jgi:CHAD domain-containing protein
MRVAIRRLRAMLALFEDICPSDVAAAATLEWIASALGAVRDVDGYSSPTSTTGVQVDPDDAEGLTAISDALPVASLPAVAA